MNIWTSVLLAWVSVNLLLVALMWRYQRMRERSARQRAAAAPAAPFHDEGPPSCPRAHAGWRCRPPLAAANRPSSGFEPPSERQRFVAFTTIDAAASTWRSTPNPTVKACASCRVQELQDEIRVLKLTVAEITLDKAMLSAAAAGRKAVS